MTINSTQTQQNDPYYLSTETGAELLANAPWRRFGVVGDSLSAGVGDLNPDYPGGPWCDRLVATLRLVNPDLSYQNTAQIGQTTPQTIESQLDALLAFEPDLIHLPSGANDIWRRSEPDWAGIETSLRTLYSRVADTDATITVFTLVKKFVVAKIPDFTDRVRRINELTRTLAGEHGAIVVDTEDHPINDRPDLLSADGIHVAGAGQAVLAAEVVRALARRLALSQ
jgi:lysophospholipase L1-like esterase